MPPISEADLFLADLMGVSQGAARRARARADAAAEAFFAELIGEQLVETTPTAEEFGEQRRHRATPNVVTSPAACPVKWAGIDKSHLPGVAADGRTRIDGTAWLGTLIDNSNLRFTGAYVTGARLPQVADDHFTNSSKAVARNWLPNVRALAEQGWGVVFFYVGYSVGGREPAPATGVDRARGIEHGLHVRTTLHALGSPWAGATVCIDNEDSDSTALTPNVIEYYLGLFDEMSRPDPNLAAFRPALYGHGQPVGELLARRRDLFVWDVHYDTGTTTTADAPYDTTVDPLTVEAATRPIRAYEATPTGGQRFISWPFGRQFRSYTGRMPSTGSAVARRLRAWQQVDNWDYNASFVRNPAFPVAEPRIAAQQYVAASLVVAGVFQARTQGPPATPPQSRVISQSAARAVVVTPAAGVTVEPDAPLTLFFRGGEMLLATVLSDGGIGVAIYDGLLGTWGPVQRAAGAVPPLRRSRALLGVANTISNAHVFYIGADDRLYVKRQTKTGRVWSDWSDGQSVADERLHPFSALAGVARRGDWLETFFIDRQGRLASAWWSSGFRSAFPGFGIQRLETTPSLLPGGALAAVTPQPDHLLVFGVGSDQRLRFAAFVAGQGWTPVTALGAAQDLVGVHTRLAVHAVSPTEVEVSALTDSGSLTIYTLRLAGRTWSGAPRQVVADPPAAGAAAAPAGSAAGFRINPFGDLAILRPAGMNTTSAVFCAGLRGSEARTLRWSATGGQPWQTLAS